MRPDMKMPGSGHHHRRAQNNGSADWGSAVDTTIPDDVPLPEIGPRHPAAFASAFAPCARRRRWALAYACPHCGGHHLGYTYIPPRGGLRRSGCGRLVWLVIARRYRAGGDW